MPLLKIIPSAKYLKTVARHFYWDSSRFNVQWPLSFHESLSITSRLFPYAIFYGFSDSANSSSTSNYRQEPSYTLSCHAHIPKPAPLNLSANPWRRNVSNYPPSHLCEHQGRKNTLLERRIKRASVAGSVLWFSAGGTGRHLGVWYTARLFFFYGLKVQHVDRHSKGLFSSRWKTPSWLRPKSQTAVLDSLVPVENIGSGWRMLVFTQDYIAQNVWV